MKSRNVPGLICFRIHFNFVVHTERFNFKTDYTAACEDEVSSCAIFWFLGKKEYKLKNIVKFLTY